MLRLPNCKELRKVFGGVSWGYQQGVNMEKEKFIKGLKDFKDAVGREFLDNCLHGLPIEPKHIKRMSEIENYRPFIDSVIKRLENDEELTEKDKKRLDEMYVTRI